MGTTKNKKNKKAATAATRDPSPPPPELWEVARFVTPQDVAGACRTLACPHPVVAVWTSTLAPTDEWPLCAPCQATDFGSDLQVSDETNQATTPGATDESKTIEEKNNTTTSTTTEGPLETPVKHEKTQMAPADSKDVAAGGTITAATNHETWKTPVPHKDEPSSPIQDHTVGEKLHLEGDEEWDLVKILSIADIAGSCPVVCLTPGCLLKAGVVYVSSHAPGEKWYSCVDCQEADFAGWPRQEELPLASLTSQHEKVLRKHCSNQPAPRMPQFAETAPPSLQSPAPTTSAKSASHVVTPLVTELQVNTPMSKPASKAALAMHRQWQQQAEAVGGPSARIVVQKVKAKKLIFDLMHDAFLPMNITQIHKALKALVPSPVLKSCLDDMSLDPNKDKTLFAASDDDEDEKVAPSKSKAKKETSADPYAASLVLKPGRNANTCLFYVDYNKQPNQGNGLVPVDKNTLYAASAQSDAEKQRLGLEMVQVRATTAQLLSEPTNEEVTLLMETQQATLVEWQEKVESARQFEADAKRQAQIKRRLQHMTAEWRKRRRMCLDFLSTMEEMTEGTIRRSKCLAGDGQIEIDSDQVVVKNVLAFHQKKKNGTRLTKKAKTAPTLSNDNFVAVRLNTQGCVERVFAK